MNKSTTVIPPAAAFALYKAYQNGYLGDLKDKIFGSASHSVSHSVGTVNELTTDVPHVGLSYFDPGIPINEADTIHGQPAVNIEFDPNVYQYYDDTCAIQSQHLILQQYGINVTQEEMIAVAKENGWYAEGYGTPMNMIGKLLEHYGIEVNGSMGNNIFNLSNELAQGHQIIVSVDSAELIYPEETVGIDEAYGEMADHALVVVGIDTTDPDNVQVIVTDPGTGNRQMAYPAEQFIEAWKDSDCFMVSTTDVPTVAPLYPYVPMDTFAGIPMDTLDRLSDMDIDMDNDIMYDRFVDDLMANPYAFDNLMEQYGELFTMAGDDDDDCDE